MKQPSTRRRRLCAVTSLLQQSRGLLRRPGWSWGCAARLAPCSCCTQGMEKHWLCGEGWLALLAALCTECAIGSVPAGFGVAFRVEQAGKRLRVTMQPPSVRVVGHLRSEGAKCRYKTPSMVFPQTIDFPGQRPVLISDYMSSLSGLGDHSLSNVAAGMTAAAGQRRQLQLLLCDTRLLHHHADATALQHAPRATAPACPRTTPARKAPQHTGRVFRAGC